LRQGDEPKIDRPKKGRHMGKRRVAIRAYSMKVAFNLRPTQSVSNPATPFAKKEK